MSGVPPDVPGHSDVAFTLRAPWAALQSHVLACTEVKRLIMVALLTTVRQPLLVTLSPGFGMSGVPPDVPRTQLS